MNASFAAVVRSIQVGRPRAMGRDDADDPTDRPWRSAFIKEPVTGPVRCGRTNLDGDEQADPSVHGGPDKAVLAYAAAHYERWRAELGIEMPGGGFGENLTVDGVTERDVCIGDVVALGDAVLQVSQPRGPCWKIGRRWRLARLPTLVQRTGRTGWYLRVLQEGTIEAGLPMRLLERPHAEWTVARANTVMHRMRDDRAETLALAAVPLLAESWRRTLERRAREVGAGER